METALLTQIVIALQIQRGNLKLDAYRLLASAVNHDLGEGITGDVAYDVKNDPRVKDQLEAIEREKFRKLFDQLSLGQDVVTVAQSFDYSFTLQDERNTIEGRLFNAIEKLGYVIFALRELEYSNREDFVDPLNRSHEGLLEYSKEFISIRILYDLCLKEIKQLPTELLLMLKFSLEEANVS
jgi:5'-deoxynucleotidase YfbR-like HD superfamily hydrolase